MKPNQRGRFNGRHGNGGARISRSQTIFRNTSLESTGPCGKLRGTALQLHEKYLAAAKDAQIQNDDILAETCLQYADHYMHIQNQAIANEQALHAQQQASRQPLTSEESAEVSPSEIPAPTTNSESLKVVDLSIPMDVLNAKSETSPAPETPLQEPRRILRPRTPRKDHLRATEETTPVTTDTSDSENNA